MSLPEIVQQFLRERVPAQSKLLVAVSGGPDSVALAHAVKSLPGRVHLGHVDHQMRRGSAADARFVQRLAKRWDVPCSVMRVRVSSHARGRGMGLEEAARDLRYRALVKMARRAGCAVIVTAHHAEDQAETVLMNLLRGAGPSGLAGIPPARALEKGISVLRPLLKVGRADILAYLKKHRLPWRQDPTNKNIQFSRNRIRRETLPLLGRQYPGLPGRLGQTADIFWEEEAFWQQVLAREMAGTARKKGKNITVDLAHLLGYHKALGRRILRHLLPGSSFQDIERVFSLARSFNGTRELQLSGGLQVTRQNNKLVIHSALRNL